MSSTDSLHVSLIGFGNERLEGLKTLRYFSQFVSPCPCGCHERLKVGSVIAAEVRQAIFHETGLTCCAGISHNKLLAKLVGGWKKPNMQTILFPEDAESFLSGLQARDIPGRIIHLTLTL